MNDVEAKSLTAEHSEETRQALLAAARQLFAEKGYAKTSTKEIVQRARVTRGALYHHFRDKRELFETIFEDVEREFAQKIAAASMAESEVWEQLRAGVQAFFDSCLEPSIQRIVLLDAPSVLGWQKWREIDAKYGFGLLHNALKSAMDAGAIEEQPVAPLAHMLLGALNEGAMLLAQAEDRNATRAQVGATMERMLGGLRAPKG